MPRKVIPNIQDDNEFYQNKYHINPFSHEWLRLNNRVCPESIPPKDSSVVDTLTHLEHEIKETLFYRNPSTVEEDIAGPYTLPLERRAKRLAEFFVTNYNNLERTKKEITLLNPHHNVRIDPHLELYLTAFVELSTFSERNSLEENYLKIVRGIYGYNRLQTSTNFLRLKREWDSGAKRQQRRMVTSISAQRTNPGKACFIAFQGDITKSVRRCLIARIARAYGRTRSRLVPENRKEKPRYLLKPFHHPVLGSLWLLILEVETELFADTFREQVTNGWLLIDDGEAVLCPTIGQYTSLKEAFNFIEKLCELSTILSVKTTNPYVGGYSNTF